MVRRSERRSDPHKSTHGERRLDVRKTYKLYIGGAFPRSESGHSYVVENSSGGFVANAALASRKDARDAVIAARSAVKGWAGRTAYNRAQVLYRVAEIMEDRRPQFSTPEPTGVVAVVAPEESSLLGLVSVVAPVIVSGNTTVVLSSYSRPLPAVTFAEVLATSDVPAGVVNILTGDPTTTAPWLASHMDVNAIDLTGLAGHADQASLAVSLEEAAAENLKRVRRAPDAVPDWTADPGLEPMTSFLEIKTVWHPIGV
jgi:acyl-CoA reductase-like NAD-dependent aldehyde dehydrogenase